MRIVVIGATGHIGTWLVPRLVRRNHDVVAVSRGSRKPYREFPETRAARHIVIDRKIAEEHGTFGSLIADLEPDAVIDLICFDRASASHLVDALRNRVQHFIHCGTLWVHGNPPTRPYDESIRREPFGHYGIHKAEIEKFLLEQAETGFPATVLHPGHITGPGWDPINPQGNLNRRVFEQLARGERVSMPGDGSATLQHVHADDVAQAFELAIGLPRESIGESFHIAARDPIAMKDFACEVASWYGRQALLQFMPVQEWQATVSRHDAELSFDHISHSPGASIAKAERLLGFNPRFSATEAVRVALGPIRGN